MNTALKTRGSSGGGGGDFIQSGGDVLPSLFAQQFCNFYSRLSLADKETLLGNLACDFGKNSLRGGDQIRRGSDYSDAAAAQWKTNLSSP